MDQGIANSSLNCSRLWLRAASHLLATAITYSFITSHIDDVVQCTLLAAKSPSAVNRSYNITDGTQTTAKAFVLEVARIAGLPEPKRHVPYAAAYILCRVSELIAQVSGGSPRINSRAALKVLGVSRYFDISRARCELGYRPKGFYRDGLRSVVAQ